MSSCCVTSSECVSSVSQSVNDGMMELILIEIHSTKLLSFGGMASCCPKVSEKWKYFGVGIFQESNPLPSHQC